MIIEVVTDKTSVIRSLDVYLIAFQYNYFDDDNVDGVTDARITIHACHLQNTVTSAEINKELDSQRTIDVNVYS